MVILIIGATGYIGEKIYEVAKKKYNVIGTRYQTEQQELIKFDMLKDDISIIDSNIEDKNKHVLICAADANIESCFKNRKISYQKNVIATIRLIDKLNNLGYHIIFLSTDNVFDGKKGDYIEEDIQTPINLYGKMKTEVEKYLMQHVFNSCIMRIGKTVGNFTSKKDLLVQWYEMAKEKKDILCIKENIFTLTHINDIIESFFLIIEKNMRGLYHIVGNESDSRINLCRNFLDYVNLETNIILKDISEFQFLESRPLNISMKNKYFIKETAHSFMNLEDIWENFVNKYVYYK